jgi:hypothetical protein
MTQSGEIELSSVNLLHVTQKIHFSPLLSQLKETQVLIM